MKRMRIVAASVIGFLAIAMPPRASAGVIQLTCKFGGDSHNDIFVLDFDKATGKWVNASVVSEGKMEVGENYILLKIDRHGPQRGTRLLVNRYTGAASKEGGDSPFSLDSWPTGKPNPGNALVIGTCIAGGEDKLF